MARAGIRTTRRWWTGACRGAGRGGTGGMAAGGAGTSGGAGITATAGGLTAGMAAASSAGMGAAGRDAGTGAAALAMRAAAAWISEGFITDRRGRRLGTLSADGRLRASAAHIRCAAGTGAAVRTGGASSRHGTGRRRLAGDGPRTDARADF